MILRDANTVLFLRGTLLLLVIVGSLKYLPISARNDTNAMMQLSGEIEEASVLVGASWFRRVTRILFPIQKSSFPVFDLYRDLGIDFNNPEQCENLSFDGLHFNDAGNRMLADCIIKFLESL